MNAQQNLFNRTRLLALASAVALAPWMMSAVFAAQSERPGLFERIPEIDYRDVNEVDMLSGTVRVSLPLLSIGDPARPLTLSMYVTSPAQEYRNVATVSCGFCYPAALGQHIAMGLTSLVSLTDDDEFGDIVVAGISGNTKAVKLPHQSARFSFRTQSPFQSTVLDGSQLVANAPQTWDAGFSYTGRDGTQALIGTAKISGRFGVVNSHYLVSEVIYPDGERWTYRYNVVNYPSSSEKISRVKSIVSSKGYGIQFSYAGNSLPDARAHVQRDAWMSVTKAVAYNKAQVACDETLLADCPAVNALPSFVQFTYDVNNGKVDIAVPGAGTTRLHFVREEGYGYMELRTVENLNVPGSARTMAYYHNEYTEEFSHSVTSVTKAGATWHYHFSGSTAHFPPPLTDLPLPPNTYFTGGTLLDPLSQRTDVNGDLVTKRVTHVSIGGHTTRSVFNTYRRPTSVTYPEGNGVSISYDGRTNPTLVTETPKPGSALLSYSTRAGYPASCASLKTCNQPLWIRDANDNQTDYTYSTDHGGVLTATGPAVNGIRPQTRFTYAQRSAWVKNGAGSYVQSANPIWLLAQQSSCKTSASTGSGCTAAGDEVITSYEYGPNIGPNNLFLRGIAVTADGQTLRTCYAYDERGNRISETKPRAALTSCP